MAVTDLSLCSLYFDLPAGRERLFIVTRLGRHHRNRGNLWSCPCRPRGSKHRCCTSRGLTWPDQRQLANPLAPAGAMAALAHVRRSWRFAVASGRGLSQRLRTVGAVSFSAMIYWLGNTQASACSHAAIASYNRFGCSRAMAARANREVQMFATLLACESSSASVPWQS